MRSPLCYHPPSFHAALSSRVLPPPLDSEDPQKYMFRALLASAGLGAHPNLPPLPQLLASISFKITANATSSREGGDALRELASDPSWGAAASLLPAVRRDAVSRYVASNEGAHLDTEQPRASTPAAKNGETVGTCAREGGEGALPADVSELRALVRSLQSQVDHVPRP
jgi:hypothetical protein